MTPPPTPPPRPPQKRFEKWIDNGTQTTEADFDRSISLSNVQRERNALLIPREALQQQFLEEAICLNLHIRMPRGGADGGGSMRVEYQIVLLSRADVYSMTREYLPCKPGFMYSVAQDKWLREKACLTFYHLDVKDLTPMAKWLRLHERKPVALGYGSCKLRAPEKGASDSNVLLCVIPPLLVEWRQMTTGRWVTTYSFNLMTLNDHGETILPQNFPYRGKSRTRFEKHAMANLLEMEKRGCRLSAGFQRMLTEFKETGEFTPRSQLAPAAAEGAAPFTPSASH